MSWSFVGDCSRADVLANNEMRLVSTSWLEAETLKGQIKASSVGTHGMVLFAFGDGTVNSCQRELKAISKGARMGLRDESLDSFRVRATFRFAGWQISTALGLSPPS
jgi:hypothetical protein